MHTMIQRARAGAHPSVGLTYHPDNIVARRLYADLGFVDTGEMDGHEVVARLALNA